MLLPHHARQMGPIYFKVPRKIQLFGVRVDGVPRQYNYLIDENQSIGINGTETHGPNTVISMLHHALAHFGYGEQECIFHADNCVGQNKNQYVMAYFSRRTQRNLHRDIKYFMQVPGHTRCLVDANFAHIKKLYRPTDCDSIHQMREMVDTSNCANNAVMYDEEPDWVWHDWKVYLKRFFRPIKNIGKYYSFRFSREHKGVVFVKGSKNEEEIAIGISNGHVVEQDTMPQEIQAAGLNLERQRYLFRNIREFVRDPWKDITCPPPVEE